jgi:hypothetical protein
MVCAVKSALSLRQVDLSLTNLLKKFLQYAYVVADLKQVIKNQNALGVGPFYLFPGIAYTRNDYQGYAIATLAAKCNTQLPQLSQCHISSVQNMIALEGVKACYLNTDFHPKAMVELINAKITHGFLMLSRKTVIHDMA